MARDMATSNSSLRNGNSSVAQTTPQRIDQPDNLGTGQVTNLFLGQVTNPAVPSHSRGGAGFQWQGVFGATYSPAANRQHRYASGPSL